MVNDCNQMTRARVAEGCDDAERGCRWYSLERTVRKLQVVVAANSKLAHVNGTGRSSTQRHNVDSFAVAACQGTSIAPRAVTIPLSTDPVGGAAVNSPLALQPLGVRLGAHGRVVGIWHGPADWEQHRPHF